ncbi:follistatin-related protein 3-like [Gigantopelta aegis]|uniref:follistatin-related protein 3-like n=1 Tax=Gigantopelta aegis TaxID=1735272 RepID=UPI001B88E4A5|nr:follistatin-related protein 3-like [Gigantopelta aegis]
MLKNSIVWCHGQTIVELCQSALEVDCETGYQEQGNETLCASDGRTYRNQCYFVKQKCVVADLTISYLGPCETTSNLTTAAPVTTTMDPLDEWQILKRVFCTSNSTISCGTQPNPICGSNRQIYFNDCMFAKAKCQDDLLSVLPVNQCSGIIGRRRKRSTLMELVLGNK